jgi:hypothetical protein
MFKDYEPTKEEIDEIPSETIHIPAEIPSIDVCPSVYKLMSGRKHSRAVSQKR